MQQGNHLVGELCGKGFGLVPALFQNLKNNFLGCIIEIIRLFVPLGFFNGCADCPGTKNALGAKLIFLGDQVKINRTQGFAPTLYRIVVFSVYIFKHVGIPQANASIDNFEIILPSYTHDFRWPWIVQTTEHLDEFCNTMISIENGNRQRALGLEQQSAHWEEIAISRESTMELPSLIPILPGWE
jgi:hypothetical protein